MSLRVVSRGYSPQEKKISSYLSHETLHVLRSRLETQKQFLMDEADRFLEHMMTQDQSQGDEMDQVQEMSWFNLRLNQCQREKQLLVQIDVAIKRIDRQLAENKSSAAESKSHYGYCHCCSDQIGEQRLQANPVTTLCIDCKEEQEVTA
jgi:DnaK suppressor protein